MSNWKILCQFVVNLIKSIVIEKELNLTLESLLKTIFNWDDDYIKNFCKENPGKSAGIIKEYQIGNEKKRPDFVLFKNDIGIVIELKKPGKDLNDKVIENQLRKYLEILENKKKYSISYKYGFLFGNEIICYYYDTTSEFYPYAYIRFNLNDKTGQKFSEVLDFNNFNKDNFEKFMKNAIEIEKEKEINSDLKFKIIDDGLTGKDDIEKLNIIKKYFTDNGFPMNAVNKNIKYVGTGKRKHDFEFIIHNDNYDRYLKICKKPYEESESWCDKAVDELRKINYRTDVRKSKRNYVLIVPIDLSLSIEDIFKLVDNCLGAIGAPTSKTWNS